MHVLAATGERGEGNDQGCDWCGIPVQEAFAPRHRYDFLLLSFYGRAKELAKE
jgi:hypothetical protein